MEAFTSTQLSILILLIFLFLNVVFSWNKLSYLLLLSFVICGAEYYDRKKSHADEKKQAPVQETLLHIYAGMNKEVLIDGFELTKSWLQDQIEQKHGVRPRIVNVEPLGPDAVGYMSVIRRVQLHWDSDQGDLPKSVIIKSSGATIENADSLEKIVHGLEIKFYRLIQDEKPKRLLVPALYAAEDYDSKQPVIVMEDYQNCFSVDLKVGFSERQLFFIAEQIAHLQIFSIRNKRWITVVQKNERDWLNHMKRTIPSLTRSISQKLMENMPGKLSCLKIFLENTIDKDPDWMGTIVDQYFNGEKPFVMIHGDMWSGQILWRDENTMAGIVDWQGAHRGSPVEDLIRTLSTSATTEMRRSMLRPLLDFYYDKMKEQLGANMPFSREDLDDEVKHISPLCCIPCIFGVAFIPKSDIVKRNEKPDNERINTFVNRCEAFVEDVIELCGWQMKHE